MIVLSRVAGYIGVQAGPTSARRFGVPPGGAFDRDTLREANALFGNRPEAPALEIAFASVELIARGDTVVGWTGADSPRSAVFLNNGDRITVGTSGRAYLSMPGGVVTSGPGLFSLRPRGSAVVQELPIVAVRSRDVLQVMKGPQASVAPAEFWDSEWEVTQAVDRVGVRLKGPAFPHEVEIPSEPACPGAIQLPPNGQPIILGPDGPTIGGYPKVAVVIHEDIPLVAQLRPGDRFRLDVR